MSLAITKRKKSIIVLAWIAPIVAIIISFSMVYEQYTKLGNTIEITLNNIDGLDVRQSHIQYNGLHIGDIDSITINENDINQFIVKATIYADYNYLIKKGSIFYKVSPTLTLNEVSALSNVLKGNFIELIPVSTNIDTLKNLQNQLHFEGYDTKPKKTGIIFSLFSNSGDFDITSAILYKGLQIGEVLQKSIDNFTINYQVLIYEKFKYLISSQTKFYKINPLELKASLEKLELSIPSLKDMISSAIGFVTPNTDKNIKTAYKLYDSKSDIELKNTIKNRYNFNILANGISNGDIIYYKGIVVGKIDTVKISNKINRVYGHIKNKYKYLLNNSTVFYKQTAISSELSTEGLKVELSNLKEFIYGGITFITPEKKGKLTSSIFTYYDDLDKFYKKNTFIVSLLTEDNYNIKKTSQLLYKNIQIGSVKNIILDKSIQIDLQIKNKYKYLFGENAKIYLQGTKISFEKIENISSTILGDNLYLIADKNNGFKSKYSLDSINPNKTYYKKGLRVQLKAQESKNITIGSPIYYKGFEVGEISGVNLSKNGEFILFDLFIKKKYSHIVKMQSKFYKATTIDMDVGVFGAKIKFGSAKSILQGGLVFTNDITEKNVINAKNGTLFHLLEEKK